MKNIFFLLILLVYGCLVYSQATPQWLFPIWFEDANGDRDTVYIGYDPDANLISGVFDEEFEDYVWVDTSKFNVLVNSGSPSPYTGDYNVDSGKIIEVASSGYSSFDIDFIKGQMPITMYWDMSLFYSNDLPYPDISPYPKAAGFVYCGAGEPGYVNCPSAFDDDPLSMVDSVNINYEFPITSPHVFEGSGVPPFNEPEEVLSSFVIDILQYQLPTLVQVNFMNIIVAPNPFEDFLNIKIKEKITSVEIYNHTGQIVQEEQQINSENYILVTTKLVRGFYILRIHTTNSTYLLPIIKQKI